MGFRAVLNALENGKSLPLRDIESRFYVRSFVRPSVRPVASSRY